MIELGNCTLDTLQIYFPWDDDLYTELKANGFGRGKSKTLPLIYTDNTEATIGQKEKRRKYVIRPELFGKTLSELGWKDTGKVSEPIIPAEKPFIRPTIENLGDRPQVMFRIIPRVNNKEQYHLEYSSMAAFGKTYSNWVMMYLAPKCFKGIISEVKHTLKMESPPMTAIVIKEEKKQAQRECMNYVELPIISYKFCIADFQYAVDFFENNGIAKSNIPCLSFDSTSKDAKERLDPYIKLGIVHTTSTSGFEERKPQIVIKLAQDKMTISKRKKKSKAKGIIIYENTHGSYILVEADRFVMCGEKILSFFEERHGVL